MFNINDIKSNLKVDYIIEGNTELQFGSMNSIFETETDSLTYIREDIPNGDALVNETKASVIICHTNFSPSKDLLKDKCFIKVENPSLLFLKLVKVFYKEKYEFPHLIHSTASISPKAKIGKNVHVGENAIIGDAEIGDNTVIKSFSIIHNNSIIGRNVLISEYCNIGGEGFSHISNEAGHPENFLHIGKVIIEDNVEIFPYTNVDRATLSTTRIGKHTKIDHFCHIGHNTSIGEDTIITAKVVMCGGSSIGYKCWIGVGSIIKDSVKVGNEVLIGMGSSVTKSVPDKQTWLGSPARPIREFLEIQKNNKAIIDKMK
jgi:UDP-3-O-[3-hydroxymyristoyl] glucosamine N-acyltransferase